MTRRKNQQRSALLRSVILPEKAWFARGEDASTTNATMHASTLLMHLLVLTGIVRDRTLQSIGQPLIVLPRRVVLGLVDSGFHLLTSMDFGPLV